MKRKWLFGLTILSLSLAILIYIYTITGQFGNLGTDRRLGNRIPVSYVYSVNPFYVFWKTHICPRCGTQLKTAYNSVIVNSNSPEANNYDFSIGGGDTYLTGDVEFRIVFFECPNCQLTIPLDEMKKLEG